MKKFATALVAADAFASVKKIVASLASVSLFFVPASRSAQTQPNDAERELFDLLNHERTANHLPELMRDDALFRAARKHALLMLDLNTFEHQLPGEPGLEERLTNAGARFTYIAENIAIGKDPATIHSGWMHSPGHRANILSPRVTAVGIAVGRGTEGLFAVEDVSQSFGDVSLEQQERQVASLLSARGRVLCATKSRCSSSNRGKTAKWKIEMGTDWLSAREMPAGEGEMAREKKQLKMRKSRNTLWA